MSYKKNKNWNYEKIVSYYLDPWHKRLDLGNEDGTNLNYKDESFDMVTSLNIAFDIKEVARVLKERGLFITEQTGPDLKKNTAQASNENLKLMMQEETEECFIIVARKPSSDIFSYLEDLL